MISVLNNNWEESKVNNKLIYKCAQDYNFSEIISRILIHNNFSEEEIFYLNNKSNKDQTFKNIKDFEKAWKLIEDQIKNNNKILLFGDYDVDGSCSVAMLAKYLKFRKAKFNYFIPDRFKDGYGPNIDLLKIFKKENYKLIIFMDCGTNAINEIDYLNSQNIKSIIIDHHKIYDLSLKPSVFINPLKSKEYNKYDLFCSSNLVFFLLRFILFKNKETKKFELSSFLIYAALGTICDVMPLKGINRKVCIEAINKFNIFRNNVFSNILKSNKINRELNIDDLGYIIGPILNSGGRLGKSNLATKLLISEDKKEIEEISNMLIQTNERRKLIEVELLNKIEKKLSIKNNYIFYNDSNLNEGILGIIAARLAEKYNVPTILLTNSGNIFKGSARSVDKVDIGKILLNSFQKGIIIKGGGHSMAGGFSILKKNIIKFDEYLSNSIKIKNNINKKTYISKHSLSILNDEFAKSLKKISPFGNMNKAPIFMFENVKIIKTKIINERHVFFIVKSGHKSCTGMAFNSLKTEIGNVLRFYKKEISILAETKENSLNSSKFQLVLKDIIF